MTAVSVVIPNWNGAAFLGATLDALHRQTVPPASIVVVDNASTDHSIDVINAHPSRPTIVRLERNRGFAGGANAGVAAVRTPFVAVVNNDARPRPDWFERLAAVMAGSPDDVWAWGGVLVAPDGTIESAGDEWHPRGQAFKLAKGKPLDALPPDPYDVFAPPGAAPVFRRDRFVELGGYVERFFMYYEDVDLALRARARGWRGIAVPDAVIEHDLGRSSRSAAAQRRVRYRVARNSLQATLRGSPDVHPRVILRTTRKELRTARRDGYAVAYLCGRLAGVVHAPRCLVERRHIHRRVEPDRRGAHV